MLNHPNEIGCGQTILQGKSLGLNLVVNQRIKPAGIIFAYDMKIARVHPQHTFGAQ